MRVSACFFALLFATTAVAQIKIPERVSPYRPILASCECPSGDGVESKIAWSISSGAHVIGSGPNAKIWGTLGKHKLSASVMSITFEEYKDAAGKTRRDVKSWDFKQYHATFEIAANPDDPKPDDNPQPQPKPTGFEQTIAAGLETVAEEHRRAKTKVAAVYSQIAGEAEADDEIDVEKMTSLAKTRITSALTPPELSAWSKFWAFQAKAFNELEMSSKSDLIKSYRRLYSTLTER